MFEVSLHEFMLYWLSSLISRTLKCYFDLFWSLVVNEIDMVLLLTCGSQVWGSMFKQENDIVHENVLWLWEDEG